MFHGGHILFIDNPKSAEIYLRRVMSFQQEEFWTLALASNLKLIEARLLFLGTVDACLVHPRDIFRFAFIANASQIMIAHNHPSGDSNPSPEDLQMTKRLVDIGRLTGVPVIDHIIVTEKSILSLKKQKLIQQLDTTY